MNANSGFHFPADMELVKPPLAEAWIEIRWQLESMPSSPLVRDPFFPYALGAFYRNVRDRFPVQKNLQTSLAPEDLLPQVVRHQFWTGEDTWPLLQIGPGIASANFVSPYTWEEFREVALYLCRNLTDAYDQKGLRIDTVSLHYRNVEAFDYLNEDLTAFLSNKLNTKLSLPEYIPGFFSVKNWPIGANISLQFNMHTPPGIGTVTIATGTGRKKGKSEEEAILVWQLDFASEGDIAPGIEDEKNLENWLTSAHNILHEWFFSLVDGPLLSKYQSRGT